MATQNHTSYNLSAADAAALRVPPINYPNGLVPGHVLSKVTGHQEEDTPLNEVDNLLKKRLLGEVN